MAAKHIMKILTCLLLVFTTLQALKIEDSLLENPKLCPKIHFSENEKKNFEFVFFAKKLMIFCKFKH